MDEVEETVWMQPASLTVQRRSGCLPSSEKRLDINKKMVQDFLFSKLYGPKLLA